jgi:hypothetical protein
MFIPIRHPHVGEPHAMRHRHPSQPARPPNLVRIEQRLARLKYVAAGCARLLVLILGLLTFHWRVLMPVSAPVVALSIALGCLALALGYSRRVTGWPALSLDSITIALLIYGTGGANSPLLPLTLLPILLGGLIGNSNGALAGCGAGVATLLIINLPRPHPMNAIVAELALLHVVFGLAVSYLWRRADELMASLRDDLHVMPEANTDLESVPPAIRWQQLNRQLAECVTLEQLIHLTISYAATIAEAAARVELASLARANGSEIEGPRTTQIAIPSEDLNGRIIIDIPRSELSLAQRDELDHLASLVGLRCAALRRAAWQERQQAALAALWEISGLLRVATTRQDHVRDGLTRLAIALDLTWLALLGSNEYHTLAPMMIVRGRTGRGTPTISGAQLRVATEALRGERPLVRAEGADALACQPICLAGHAPLVLVAYGNAGDAATQALLMLFGNLVVERLASDKVELDAETIRFQALAA